MEVYRREKSEIWTVETLIEGDTWQLDFVGLDLAIAEIYMKMYSDKSVFLAISLFANHIKYQWFHLDIKTLLQI